MECTNTTILKAVLWSLLNLIFEPYLNVLHKILAYTVITISYAKVSTIPIYTSNLNKKGIRTYILLSVEDRNELTSGSISVYLFWKPNVSHNLFSILNGNDCLLNTLPVVLVLAQDQLTFHTCRNKSDRNALAGCICY